MSNPGVVQRRPDLKISEIQEGRVSPRPLSCNQSQASQAKEKSVFVIPSEARDLLFFSASKKQQIPRANTALRNDKVRVFSQPVQPL
jgi:hypothetical protein